MLKFKPIQTELKAVMEALRIITQPVNRQLIIDLPPSLTGDQQYEVIVLPISSQESVTTPPRRRPSEKLAGTVHLFDDLIAPTTPDSDWESS
ncbi:MAG: hypothetical protein P5702_24350 [Limnospira sp. PMC 1291.21]|nr:MULTISPECIES: hypothetical protein [Oscillatoriales]MDC0838092.1 hypothetical protein [Limnoraphis robusta]MDT9180688.1 hypothetical protein [Limnospira sp. PMC 1238.20]MDT9196044.1 hypothetical protein [Limnospira sp. PMC 1245.20]MDT9206269.1 hypothetical protein [Limnospira sp. PMC 1243.20]MDT9211393.1 hypothetical protein [Limnospira sp. PMC 1252.20]